MLVVTCPGVFCLQIPAWWGGGAAPWVAPLTLPVSIVYFSQEADFVHPKMANIITQAETDTISKIFFVISFTNFICN